MIIRALSLWQPWASAMVLQGPTGLPLKQIETRGWECPSEVIGQSLAICASKTNKEIKDWHHKVATARRLAENPESHLPDSAIAILALADAGIEKESQFPLGKVLGVCRVMECVRGSLIVHQLSAVERSLGGYEDDPDTGEVRWAWMTESMTPLPEPTPIVGRQKFFPWEVPVSLEPLVRRLKKGAPCMSRGNPTPQIV